MKTVDDTKSNEYQPSVALRQFVQALLSEEVAGNKTRAEAASGVRRQRFYKNLTNPEFRIWFSRQCDEVLLINQASVASSLLSMATKGDVSAIRTYYELIGKLKNKLEHSGKVQGVSKSGSFCTQRETSFCPIPQKTFVFMDAIPPRENEKDITRTDRIPANSLKTGENK